jgi:uncharacterized membrane protein
MRDVNAPKDPPRASEGPRSPASRALLILGAITLVAFGLRVATLSRASLWLDEASEAQFAGYALKYCWIADPNVPPLNRTILHFWTYLFGNSEFSLRFPSALFGTLCVPAIYLLGKQTFGGKAGFTAALLLAFSPFGIEYSQEARQYPLLVLAAILATYYFLKAVERRRAGPFFMYALLVAAGMYTYYLFLLVVLGQIIWYLIFAGKSRGVSKGLVASYILAGLLFLPWLPNFFHAMGKQDRFWIEHPYWQAYHMFHHFGPGLPLYDFRWLGSGTRFTGEALQDWALVKAFYSHAADAPSAERAAWIIAAYVVREIIFIVGFIVPFIVGLSMALRQRGKAAYFAVGFVFPVIFLAAFFFLVPLLYPRYIQFILPCFLILVSLFLLNSRARRFRVVVIACMVPLTALSLATLYFSPQYGKEDFRSVARYLEEKADTNDAVICLPGYIDLGVKYYYRGGAPVLRGVPCGPEAAANIGPEQAAADLRKLKTEFTTCEEFAQAVKTLAADPNRKVWVVIRGDTPTPDVNRYDEFFRKYFAHFGYEYYPKGWGTYVRVYSNSPFEGEYIAHSAPQVQGQGGNPAGP